MASAPASSYWQDYYKNQNQSSPTSLFGNPSTFTAAANTQGTDYDAIMKQYDDVIKNMGTNPLVSGVAGVSKVGSPNPLAFSAIAPQITPYKQSSNVTNSLASLKNLTDTGGYSEADKANLRERGISPTRSIYAGAQRNVERQRALSGGYSPNFNAVQAKMAREEADQIGNINTNVNAGIAQNVASNKISIAPSYASASANANAAKTAADQKNADIVNQINQINSQGKFSADEFNTSVADSIAKFNAGNENQNNQFNVNSALEAAKFNKSNALNTFFESIKGKNSLYGTTPALTNLFGNQVGQAAQINQNQQDINTRRYGLVGQFGR